MKKVYIGDKELTTIAVGETTSTSTGNSDETIKGIIEGNITSIDIPNGTTKIKDYLFWRDDKLTNVNIPDSVTRIGDYSICDCQNLSSLRIGSSVTSIGKYAFYLDSALTDINYNGTAQQWNSITKRDNSFSNYSNITVHCTDGDYQMIDDKGTLS